jgi:integrase
MPRMRFTNASVAKVRAAGKPTEFFDELLSGFGLRVMPSGSRAFFAMGRINGAVRRYPIGKAHLIELAEARETARNILRQLAQGIDPEAARREEEVSTVQHVVASFAAKRLAGLRSGHDVRKMLERELVIRYGSRPISSLTRGDVIAMLDEMMTSGRTTMANRTLAATRRLLAWSAERELVAANVAQGVRPPHRERSRDRILDDAELAAVWCAAGEITNGDIIRLLILLGCRRDEAGDMEWSEIDLQSRTLTIAAHRYKSGRQHVILLSEAAVEILCARHSEGASGRVFPVVSWHKRKVTIDELSGVRDWRLHDLRRSVASNLARMGVAPQVLARCLGHSAAPSASGVLRVYNKYSYDREGRAALEAWSRELERIVSGRSGKVIRLR